MEKNTRTKSNNTIQIARRLTQFVFLGLLVAGLYMDMRIVIMVLLPATLFFGNFFCGWVCPYGTLQELMRTVGKLIFKKQYKMPRSIQKFMQYSKYVLFTIMMVGVLDFILTPINGYGTLMGLFSETGETIVVTLALGIMIIYLLISMVFERAYCNYLCTESAKYGILSLTRIFSIKRNEDTCIGCNKCDKVCPMNIEVSMHDQVRNGQCINCMKCVQACPVDKTLSYSKVKIKSPLPKKTTKTKEI